MKLTLITACFNSAAVIRTALESVLAQKGCDLEYLVVDGGSTDGTVDILKEYEERFRSRSEVKVDSGDQDSNRHCSPSPSTFTYRWLSEKDNGMYDAINKGIRMATGEFVGILNADDYLDGEDVLARVAREVEKVGRGGQRIDCCFGNVRFVDPKDLPPSPPPPFLSTSSSTSRESVRTKRVCFARFWKPWMLHWGYMPPHPAIFIRKSCFEKWGGYVPSREEYRIAADYELLIRFFCKNRMTHRYMPINTTVMRLGGVSTKDVEARKKLNEEIIKGNRVNGYRCYWPMLLPKYAIKIWEVILPRLGLLR